MFSGSERQVCKGRAAAEIDSSVWHYQPACLLRLRDNMADSSIRLTHLQKQLNEVGTAVPLLWVWHGPAAHLHLTASKMRSKASLLLTALLLVHLHTNYNYQSCFSIHHCYFLERCVCTVWFVYCWLDLFLSTERPPYGRIWVCQRALTLGMTVKHRLKHISECSKCTNSSFLGIPHSSVKLSNHGLRLGFYIFLEVKALKFDYFWGGGGGCILKYNHLKYLLID